MMLLGPQINNMPSKSLVIVLLLYRHECFTGKLPLVKFIKKLRPVPEWFIFHNLKREFIDDFIDIKFLLNSLVYHRNICGSSSKVFGNLRKFSENVRERSSGLRNNFRKSSEIFGRWSEIFGKSSKTPSSACLYNKKNITRRIEDMNFIFSWQKQYFTHSLRSFVKYCFAT